MREMELAALPAVEIDKVRTVPEYATISPPVEAAAGKRPPIIPDKA
jgi:hypothetical protein